jgi:hypothetical protein
MAPNDEIKEPFGADVVREMLYAHLGEARAQFKDSINRLWAGCGGGLIGVVTVLRHPKDLTFWLSAGSFGGGILILGIGTIWSLIAARSMVRHLEEINGILELRGNYSKRLSVEAGLSLSHPQTWTGITAAVLFMVGVGCAIVLVWRH